MLLICSLTDNCTQILTHTLTDEGQIIYCTGHQMSCLGFTNLCSNRRDLVICLLVHIDHIAHDCKYQACKSPELIKNTAVTDREH